MPSECADTHIRLDLSGVPAVYTADELRDRAEQVVQEVEDLLQLQDLLIHSTLRYLLSQEVDAKAGTFKHLILLDLVPKRAAQLDLFTGALDREALAAAMATESQALLDAFRAAPQRCDRARVLFAMRNAAAVSHSDPAKVPMLGADVRQFLTVRRRSFSGHLSGFRWQLQLDHVGFDWDCTLTQLRVRLYRERDGFSLRPLNAQLACGVRRQRLRMGFPADLEALATLDRAAHTGQALGVQVRLGRNPGDEAVSRADFVRFDQLRTAENQVQRGGSQLTAPEPLHAGNREKLAWSQCAAASVRGVPLTGTACAADPVAQNVNHLF